MHKCNYFYLNSQIIRRFSAEKSPPLKIYTLIINKLRFGVSKDPYCMSDRIYITIGVFRSHITIITSRYCGDIPVIASGAAAEQKSRELRSIDIRVFSGFVIGGEPFRVRTRRRSFPRELPAEVRIPASRGATARGCRLRPSAPGFFHRGITLLHTEKVLLLAVFCYGTKTKRSCISLICRIIRFILRNLAQQKRPFEKDLVSGKRDSDPRPQPWQGCALPTELFPQSIPAPRKPLFPAFRDCKYKMKKIILQNFPTNFIT